MQLHHKLAIISVVIIMLGISLVGYDVFLDGTYFNRPEVYNLPKQPSIPDTAFFSPIPIGSVAGIYATVTDKTSYNIGDYVFIKNNFCKNSTQTPKVRITFKDSIPRSFEWRDGALTQVGCTKKDIWIPLAQVPEVLRNSAPDENYTIQSEVVYEQNPFRKIEYILESNEFRINK